MSLLLDVLEVLAGGPAGWILLTHVAKPAGELGKFFAVGALAQPLHGKMFRLGECRPGDDGDSRLSKNHGGEISGVATWSR